MCRQESILTPMRKNNHPYEKKNSHRSENTLRKVSSPWHIIHRHSATAQSLIQSNHTLDFGEAIRHL